MDSRNPNQTPLEVHAWMKCRVSCLMAQSDMPRPRVILSVVPLSFWYSLQYICDIPSPPLWHWTLPLLPLFSPLTAWICPFSAQIQFQLLSNSKFFLVLELKVFAAFTEMWVQTPQLWGSARLREVSRAGMWLFIFGPAPRSSWIYLCSSWLTNAGCLSFIRKNKFSFFAGHPCRHECCRNVMEPSLASS